MLQGSCPIITFSSCNLTNTRFCHEKGFVENTRFCRKMGFIANTRLFGFVWCRLLRRHLGFDSDFAQISGLKIGGWHLCIRVAEVAREHGWHPPKSLDSDENFKPEHTLFCRELRFVAIYALFFWRSLGIKSAFLGKNSASWARSALLHGIYCIFY